jgi:NAD(P)H-nitrite reductase large subunit
MRRGGERVRYVIVGNSAAAVGCVEGIRQLDPYGPVTLITRESGHTYSRPLISYLLAGKVTEEGMKYRPDDFYTANNCEVIYDEAAAVSGEGKYVTLKAGGRVPYDKLLVATGSVPFVPPFEGLGSVEKKFTFMSLADALALRAALGPSKRVLIIGAGLIGLKCAEGILHSVAGVTVIDLAPDILSSILDPGGAALVRRHIESKGAAFKLSASVKRFEGNTAVLESGETIDFDILVLAVGVRPNVSLLRGVADIDKGVIVGSKSQTSAPDIYAAGDCAQTADVTGVSKVMALLPNAYMQGQCAGLNMAGGEKARGDYIPMNAIGFFGLHVITAGVYAGQVYAEESEGHYKRLFYDNDRLNGYILVGGIDKAGIYTSLIRNRTPLSAVDFELVCQKPGLMAFTKEVRKTILGGDEPSC